MPLNEDVFDEFQFFLNTEAKEIGDNEKNKILSLSSTLINSQNYMDLVKTELEKISSTPNFNFMTDFAVLIKCIIELNKYVDFYKELTIDRLKYLFYPVLYAYLYKNKPELLKSDLRMMYVNAMDLILIPIETVKIVKENCVNCCARKISFLSIFESKKKI